MPSRRSLLAVGLAALLASSARAQTTPPADAAKLAATLPSLAGLPRARALAKPTTTYENERPKPQAHASAWQPTNACAR